MYTLNLLAIALELAKEDPCYEDVASKFWEHFIYIAHAMNHRGQDGMGLWNEEDGFFYDVLQLPDGNQFPMKIRSMVGLIPLFAVETLEPEVLDKLPDFKRRLEWFIDNRPISPKTWPACAPRAWGTAVVVHRRPRPAPQHPEVHVGRARVPFAVRHSGPVTVPP